MPIRTTVAKGWLGRVSRKRDKKIRKARSKAARKKNQIRRLVKKANQGNLKTITGRPATSKEAIDMIKAKVALLPEGNPHTVTPIPLPN